MSTIAEMETLKEDLKRMVELRDQLTKLRANHEFRKLIDDGYIRDEAARSIRMAGDPTIDPKDKATLIEMALAAGHLQRYLSFIFQAGNSAEGQLSQVDETLDELRAEGAE